MEQLGITWTDAWLTIVSAVGIYAAVVGLSRVFGQRQFGRVTTYDLPFVFAMGTMVGRVVLVRTTLLGGVLGLTVMFLLHAATGALHHRYHEVHRITENSPVLLVVDGAFVEDHLERAHTSDLEVREQIRLAGFGQLEDVGAVVMERTGAMSVIGRDSHLDRELFVDVAGAERLSTESP